MSKHAAPIALSVEEEKSLHLNYAQYQPSIAIDRAGWHCAMVIGLLPVCP